MGIHAQRGQPHRRKIYYHHTDSGGVVYYAEYLKFFEEARTEFMAERGVVLNTLMQQGTMFVVSRQEVDYKKPARYADTIEIHTAISASTAVRLEFAHEVRNQDGELLVTAKTMCVCVDGSIKPKAIPPDIKEKLLPS